MMLVHNVFSKKMKNPGCSILILNEKKIIDGIGMNYSIVCVADQEGFLTFYNMTNGDLLYEIQMECKSEIWSLVSISISLTNYNIYVGSATGHIYAYKIIFNVPESGSLAIELKKIWEQKADDLITKMECIDLNQDGKVEIIASSMDHSLRVLDAESGKFIWGQLFQAGIAYFKIAALNGIMVDSVICSAIDGSLRVFNSKNGDLIKFSMLANNIRTIEVINTPKKIGNTIIYSNSPKAIVCGCDDYYLYIIDGGSLNVLISLNIGSYIWNSGLVCFKEPQTLDLFYISTYSFNFMEGLVVPNTNDKSFIRFYNAQSFDILAEIMDINIQTITYPIKFEKFQVILVGTIEKKVHLIDLDQKKIICSIDAEDIVNAVDLCINNNKMMIYYCDDKCNFRGFKIENF